MLILKSRRCMPVVGIAAALLFVLASCGQSGDGFLPSKSAVLKYSASDGFDPCARYGWYGDGECDDPLEICAEPDLKDCGPSFEPTPATCESLVTDVEFCLADGLEASECVGEPDPVESTTSRTELSACCDTIVALEDNPICAQVFPNTERCKDPMMSVDFCLGDGLSADECVDYPTDLNDSVTDPDLLEACCDAVSDTTTMQVCDTVFGSNA